MHSDSDTDVPMPSSMPAVQAISKEARRLHRASVQGSLVEALPVLRRLIATDAIREMTLPELNRQRDTIRRKHILRMLAVEAGHPTWESYRRILGPLRAEDLAHFDLHSKSAGSPNCWFASFEEAVEHARLHGGRPLRLGRQGVVLAEMESATKTGS